MLYDDSQKRIEGINNIANIFATKGYPKTEIGVRAFVEILQGDKVPPDFLERLDSILDINQNEFASSFPIGQEFRKRCFKELRETVIKSIGKMQSDYAPALLTISAVFERLAKAKEVSGLIADVLGKRDSLDKKMVFHLVCYAYLVFIEGVFDELARILYFHAIIEKAIVPTLLEIEKVNVWKAKQKFEELFGSTPVFLEKWEIKNHIRNAIGHARVEYDPVKEQARFTDIGKNGNLTYDSGYIQFNEFLAMLGELENSVTAFAHILRLLRVYDYVLAPSEFI